MICFLKSHKMKQDKGGRTTVVRKNQYLKGI